METRLCEIQDIIRNGLMSVHKTLMDTKRSLEQTECRVNQMMDSFQELIDGVRNGPTTETDRDENKDPDIRKDLWC